MAIRKIDGGYYVEVFLGTDPVTGKKIRKTKTFRPRTREKLKEAKAWEIKIEEDYKTGNLELKSSMTLNDYLNYWFDTFIKNKKAYNTERRYKSLMECIQSRLGHVKLDKLKTPMVDRFYSDLQEEMITLKDGTIKRRYMDGTILKTHKLFRQAMEQAVTWEMIVKNPVNGAKPPQDDKRSMNTWSIKEVNTFLDKIKDTQIYLPVLIAYHTGLREGEIAALRWEDINLKKGYLTVNHTMVEKKGEGLVLEEPKTESSKAPVALTKELKSVLESVLKEKKKHKLRTGIDLEFVCSWGDGRPLRPTYISKVFTRYVKEFGMKKITFHGLRHSHATILYTHGANSHEISKRLRHSRVSTTDDIYIHVTDEIKKSTAQLFDQAIEKSK